MLKYDAIEQYTGLHDANGREIYEGDIVERGLTAGHINVVEWGTIGWEPFESDGVKPHRVEVIGNIHEHAHLLDKEATR